MLLLCILNLPMLYHSVLFFFFFLNQRMVCCRVKQGEWVAPAQKPQTPTIAFLLKHLTCIFTTAQLLLHSFLD